MKVISWNIFNGQSSNPALPSPGLADSIRASITSIGADVLAVQEVDENQSRSGNVHQMEIIAAAMEAPYWGYARAVIGTPGVGWRHPSDAEKIIHSESIQSGYGIGLASKIPVRRWHRIDLSASLIGIPLPFPTAKGFTLKYTQDEPRVAIVAELENGFTVTATHLSFVPFWNYFQMLKIMRFLRTVPGRHIIVGDLNMAFNLPDRLTSWKSLASKKTYPSYKPSLQFDYILAAKKLKFKPLVVPDSLISDHRPVGVSIELD
jgi:endonuclease/exonuclease/phosphatase family metal-dependent hydrolase